MKVKSQVFEDKNPIKRLKSLTTLDTYGNCQRPVLSLGVSQHAQNNKPMKLVVEVNLSATRSSEVHITNYSNNSHEPEGALVCVRTLCVHQDFRNKGVATKLLKHFIQYVQENVKNVRKMGLICHDNLIPMYVKLGFQCRGLSEMPGDPPWYYMERSIGGN
ncbi:uncharacterized protein LOC117304303 isoform X2 [Asterias rubens]|uniref:uncharacterized protein LOC117304303 isoform X2 n=1 Tax=Asterias rubens TaxID=7604 RepID=UPI0014551C2D|nr:uncharacterized protein LOC117304303 isoform X2 [Asterias rubens]